MAGGPVASLHRAVTVLQNRQTDEVWRSIGGFMDTDWAGLDRLVVSTFYYAAHNEWPQGPSPQRLRAFVNFVDECYDDIVAVPLMVTEAVVRSVFTADYTIFQVVPRDTLLTLQLLVIAALTGHRRVRGSDLSAFLTWVYAQVLARPRVPA